VDYAILAADDLMPALLEIPLLCLLWLRRRNRSESTPAVPSAPAQGAG
jgi:hypothetical protein